MRAFALSYCILLCLIWGLSLKDCSFLKRNKGGVALGERRDGGLGGVEGRETVVWIYCMREESIFS